MTDNELQTHAKSVAQDMISMLTNLEELHNEIMTLDAMAIDKGMVLIRRYSQHSYLLLGTINVAREVQQVKAAWAAHYRHKERELAFSRERAEQRALWLVPLIRWGCGSAVGSVALASAVWAVRLA